MTQTNALLPWINDIIKARILIPASYLAAERHLLLTKWPGYRFHSPWQATMLFLEAYKKAYKAFVAANYDFNHAANMEVAGRLRLDRNNAHLTQLWAARQHADGLGIPYENYLAIVFEFVRRRQRKQPPQPNQLRPTPAQEEAWRELFAVDWNAAAWLLALGRMEALPHYCRDNDRGLPAQTLFRDKLVEMSLYHGNLDSFVGLQVIKYRRLTTDDLLERHPAEAVMRADAAAQRDIPHGFYDAEVYPPVAGMDLVQSCFGLAPVDRSADSVCAFCPTRETCARMYEAASEAVKRRTGSVDPVAEKKRQDNCARQRKFKAKRKAAKAGPAGAAGGVAAASVVGF